MDTVDAGSVAAFAHLSALPARQKTVEALYATAHWLLTRGRPEDAARVFRIQLRVAPRDERAWLGLGECHERRDQLLVAAELYGTGSVLAGTPRSGSVRCMLARARILAALGRTSDVERTLDHAQRAAAEQENEELQELVAHERRRLS